MLVNGNGFDNETTVVSSESSSSMKFRLTLGAGLLFTLVIIFMTAGSGIEEKKENDSGESIRYSRYKKNIPQKGSPSWKDYCTLKEKIDKIIDPNCYCECKKGFKSNNVNWFNPPVPEELGEDWEEVYEEKHVEGSKHFRNIHTQELVRFDLKHRSNGSDHYHRYSYEIKNLKDVRKFKKGNKYLDICGEVLKSNIDEDNHILIIDKKYKVEEQELCNDDK